MNSRIKRLIIFLVIAVISIPTFAFGAVANYGSYYTWDNGWYYSWSQPEDTISIIYTNDINGQIEAKDNKGGMGRAMTEIKQLRADYPDSYLFDAGGFTGESQFEDSALAEAYEYKVLSAMAYDASTLGNEEFRYGLDGLTKLLNSAVKNKGYDTLPQLVTGNLDLNKVKSDSKFKNQATDLEKALKDYDAANYFNSDTNNYRVIEKYHTKIAVFGIGGWTDNEKMTIEGFCFSDPVEAAKSIVSKIKKNEEDIDAVVCLAHCGGTALEEELADSVSGIDVIIAADTKDSITSPKTINNTTIVSTAGKGQAVGHLVLQKDDKKGLKIKDCKEYSLDSKLEEAETIKNLIIDHENVLDEAFKDLYGFGFSQTLTNNRYSFINIENFGKEQGDESLGDLIADAYKYTVNKFDGKKSEKIDAVVVAVGAVKSSIPKGGVAVKDVYNMFSQEVQKDGTDGNSLVNVYLSGSELKILAEVDASISDSNREVRLYTSGLEYTYNPHRFHLNQVSDIWLNDDGNKAEIENKELYRVVTDMETLRLIDDVYKAPLGLMDLAYKDSKGQLLDSIDKCIIYKNKEQVKQWYAVATYINDKGISQKYSQDGTRKALDDSKSLKSIFAHPSKVFTVSLCIVVIGLALLILVIYFVAYIVRRALGIKPKSKYKAISKKNQQKPIFSNRKNKYRSRMKVKKRK